MFELFGMFEVFFFLFLSLNLSVDRFVCSYQRDVVCPLLNSTVSSAKPSALVRLACRCSAEAAEAEKYAPSINEWLLMLPGPAPLLHDNDDSFSGVAKDLPRRNCREREGVEVVELA